MERPRRYAVSGLSIMTLRICYREYRPSATGRLLAVVEVTRKTEGALSKFLVVIAIIGASLVFCELDHRAFWPA